LARAYGSYP